VAAHLVVEDADGNRATIVQEASPAKPHHKGAENLRPSQPGKLVRTAQERDVKTGKFVSKPKPPSYLQTAGRKAANRIRNILTRKNPKLI
jgi:hypothetical protein